MSTLADAKSPLDSVEWPTKLVARVVSPGARPTVHGYDVEGDLARDYSFAETVLLALTGEAPEPDLGRAFELVLVFAAPVSVVEAPVHAAVVARACVASPSQLLGVAALGLAEQTRVLVEGLRGFLDALSGNIQDVAPRYCASSDEERASVGRLRAGLAPFLHVPGLTFDLGRTAAIVAALHACGLRTAEQIECALSWARLPLLLAEALAAKPGSHMQYPVNVPAIVYEEQQP
ncbi:MAG TPA: hypothetical protein VGG39_36470 [Polyangiaceae bacterium]|jgi:hypothetical protein